MNRYALFFITLGLALLLAACQSVRKHAVQILPSISAHP